MVTLIPYLMFTPEVAVFGEFKIPLQTIIHAENNVLPQGDHFSHGDHFKDMFEYKRLQMSARELANRAKRTHNDTGVFQCPTPHCNRIYSRRRSLNRHKQECGQLPRYKCTLCPYRGKRKDSLKSHMVHGHKIIDQQLQEQFMNRENVLDTTYEDDEIVRNDDIGNVYEEWSRRQLEEMRRELGDVDENEPGPVVGVLNNKDDDEGKSAASKPDDDLVYQVDYRGQVKFFEQPKPTSDKNDIREDKDPLGNSENEIDVVATNENGSKITSPINLYNSLLDILLCRCCDEYLVKNESFLLNHCRTCKEMKRPNEKYRHVCYECNYYVKNAWQMKNHIRRHLGEKPFKCILCDYKATKKNLLKYHYKTKHEGEPNEFDDEDDVDINVSSRGVYVLVK
ncbi:hypothetical protein WDU94_006322 [Cyamophila willieti]